MAMTAREHLGDEQNPASAREQLSRTNRATCGRRCRTFPITKRTPDNATRNTAPRYLIIERLASQLFPRSYDRGLIEALRMPLFFL